MNAMNTAISGRKSAVPAMMTRAMTAHTLVMPAYTAPFVDMSTL